MKNFFLIVTLLMVTSLSYSQIQRAPDKPQTCNSSVDGAKKAAEKIVESKGYTIRSISVNQAKHPCKHNKGVNPANGEKIPCTYSFTIRAVEKNTGMLREIVLNLSYYGETYDCSMFKVYEN